VLAPPETHRGAVDGEIDVGDDRTFFHLGRAATRRTSRVDDDLFDDERDVASTSFVVEHANVL
jgi:hypothetical protein